MADVHDGAVIYDASPVKCRAEELNEIWWQGRQWAVTSYGIERRDGTYYIEADRLTKKRLDTELADWPLHLAEKNRVDVADFCTAFLIALTLHGKGSAFTGDILLESCRHAFKIQRRRDTWKKATRDMGLEHKVLSLSDLEAIEKRARESESAATDS